MEEKNRELKSCLRNEIVIVRKLPKKTGLVTDSSHIMGDGMHNNAFRTYCVPKLEKSNNLVNVLTNDEKDYLEYVMGLEHNALSIYKQPSKENYWSTANPARTGIVTLYKRDNRFDLSKAADYIAYKILMANKDKICQSLEEWEARPKETYEFVIIHENQETQLSQSNTDVTIQAAMKLGKIAEDVDVLKVVVETMMGRKYGDRTTKEWLKTQALDLIKSQPKNARLFMSIVTDDSLDNKVLIRKCIAKGIIADRGGFLYIKEGNQPMCGSGEDPTIKNAARWLSKAKNQEVLFSLQAKLKEE